MIKYQSSFRAKKRILPCLEGKKEKISNTNLFEHSLQYYNKGISFQISCSILQCTGIMH